MPVDTRNPGLARSQTAPQNRPAGSHASSTALDDPPPPRNPPKKPPPPPPAPEGETSTSCDAPAACAASTMREAVCTEACKLAVSAEPPVAVFASLVPPHGQQRNLPTTAVTYGDCQGGAHPCINALLPSTVSQGDDNLSSTSVHVLMASGAGHKLCCYAALPGAYTGARLYRVLPGDGRSDIVLISKIHLCKAQLLRLLLSD